MRTVMYNVTNTDILITTKLNTKLLKQVVRVKRGELNIKARLKVRTVNIDGKLIVS